MTPIFKRYIKKEAVIMLVLIMCSAAQLMMDVARTSPLDRKLYKMTVGENITPETFDSKDGREKIKKLIDDLYLMQEKNNHGIWLTEIENEKGVNVPDPYCSLVSTVDRAEGYAAGMGFGAAIALAALTFRMERRKNTMSFVGSLPYKREKMFAEKWLAGAVCLLLFFAANYLMIQFRVLQARPAADACAQRLCCASGVRGSLEDIGSVILDIAFLIFVFYSLMMLVQTLFGKPVYAVLLVLVGIFMLLGSECGLRYFCKSYGFAAQYDAIANLKLHIGDFLDNKPAFRTCAVLLSALFFGAGALGSRAARIERVGGIFMFPAVKWLVYLCFALCGAPAFFGFAVYNCGFDAGSIVHGIFLLGCGAVLTVLVLKKLFSLEV